MAGDDHTGDVGRVEIKTSTWMGPDIDLEDNPERG